MKKFNNTMYIVIGLQTFPLLPMTVSAPLIQHFSREEMIVTHQQEEYVYKATKISPYAALPWLVKEQHTPSHSLAPLTKKEIKELLLLAPAQEIRKLYILIVPHHFIPPKTRTYISHLKKKKKIADYHILFPQEAVNKYNELVYQAKFVAGFFYSPDAFVNPVY
jgi:hypothetical protein